MGLRRCLCLMCRTGNRSYGLNAPGNSSAALDPHSFLTWPRSGGQGKYFPLAFSRKKVEEVTKDRLVLYPETEHETEEAGRGV